MAEINQDVAQVFDKGQERMEKTILNLKSEFMAIRAGRANPHILDKVLVSCYGSMTPINQIGNINVTDARCLTIMPWDVSNLKALEKALMDSNIGITPVNDGKTIRLVFPVPTEERRRDLVKQVKKFAEDTKVTLRKGRRDVIESIKKLKNDNLLTEDDVILYTKDFDKIFNKFSEQVDVLAKDKEKEIMEV